MKGVFGIALGLAATAAVVWTGLRLPPPDGLWKHWPEPYSAPTGRTWVIEEVEFVEIGPGLSLVGPFELKPTALRERLETAVGLRAPLPEAEAVRWAEFPRPFAIARTEVTVNQFERFEPRPPISIARGTVPVLNHFQCRNYCEWLASRSDLPVRLPAEAEWQAGVRLIEPAGNIPRELRPPNAWTEAVLPVSNLGGTASPMATMNGVPIFAAGLRPAFTSPDAGAAAR